MIKSPLLASVALLAFTTPAAAFAQDNTQGQPTQQETSAEPSATEQTGAVAETADPADTTGDAGVEGDRESQQGDIIVTATRRSEALSDVPLAVSAITAETLENSGVTDLRQLNQVSPSLVVASGSSEAGAGAARIRGIGTVGENPGLESSVATFIDGVYRSRTGVGLTELGQIDRVEVLRGPQGTLFGRNASAGLISIITARPQFEFGGNAEVSIGNYDQRRVELGLTGPLLDTLAFRLDGVYFKRDGFLYDVVGDRRVNNRDRYLVRGQLLFQPNDDVSFRLIGDYTDRDEECCGAVYLPAFNVSRDASGSIVTAPNSIAAIERGLGGVILQNPRDRDISITPGRDYAQDVRDYGVSGELNVDFGVASLTSITAYREFRLIRGQDSDFNNLDILFRASDGGARQKFETFSQEVRLQGEAFNDRLDFLIGGYYARETLNIRDNLSYGADYGRYANCLLFASVLPAAVAPTPTGQCVNVPVVQATLRTLSSLPPGAPQRANIPLLSALIANPANPGFGSLATVLSPTAPPLLAGVRLNDRYEQTSRNYALFTHNIFDIIRDKLSVTVGLRYTNERKTLDATLTDNNVLCRTLNASPFAALQAIPCVIPSIPGGTFTQENARKSEDELSGTGVLSFKPVDEALLYASYSRGYKAGGFNLDRSALSPRSLVGTAAGPLLPGINLNTLTFDPEIVDAYEIGAKLNLRGFDLNVAVFRQDFDSFQLNTFNGVNFEVANVNACSTDLGGGDTDNSAATGACPGQLKPGVRSEGFELEGFLRPHPDVSVNLGFTYNDTKFRRNLVGTDGAALSPTLFQLPGRRLSFSSQYNTTAAFTFTPDIGNSGLSGLFYLDGRFQSDFQTGSDLDLEKAQDAVTIVNARVGLRGPDGRWGVELFGQNIFNTLASQTSFDLTLQGSGTTRAVQRGFIPVSNQLFGAFLNEPRTYGVTLRARF